jgi:hypothetical protein
VDETGKTSEEGMKFFPLVYSIFMFILVSSLIGMIPYAFTVSSHYRDGRIRAARVLHGADPWLLQERPEVLQDFRAGGHFDLPATVERIMVATNT